MSSQSVIPTCYRHADRETRLACSNCERPICGECVRPAPVGQRCLECVSADQRQRVMDMDDVKRQANRAPPVTMVLLGLSVLAFFAIRFVPGVAEAAGGFVQVNSEIAKGGQWWRAITAAFLHDGPTHLILNMYALYVFGPPLEREVGSAPFAALYFACALGGGAAFYLLERDGFAVGASGAIFGLFGAWIVASYRGRHTTQGQANLRSLLMLLGINLVIGFVPGFRIAWQAHLGGLVAGAAIAYLWALPALRNRLTPRTLAAVAVGAVALLPLILL